MLKAISQLYRHPWIAMVMVNVILLILILVIIIAANYAGIPDNAPYRSLITPTLAHILLLFIIVPFIFKLPYSSMNLRQYAADIHLSTIQPFLPLLVLGVTASLIALLAFSVQSLAYRMVQGQPITLAVLHQMFPIQKSLRGYGYIHTFPSIFEEIAWRGVFLTLFMKYYSPRKSIIITAIGFSAFHTVNLLFGTSPAFVLRQVIFSAGMGLFYGIMVLKTCSLLPAMLFHYLVNWFIGSCTYYMQHFARENTQTIYLAITTPLTTAVLILWVLWFTKRLIWKTTKEGIR